MVSCRRCGKQGWRYQMEISAGRWYCERCYALVENGDAPVSVEADDDIKSFMQEHRTQLEFARYLAKKGLLNEGIAATEATEGEYAYSAPTPIMPFWNRPAA